MNKLNDMSWFINNVPGPVPYRRYDISEQVVAKHNTSLWKKLDQCYNGCLGVLTIDESYGDCCYTAMPLGYNDKLQISHWETWPNNLTLSNMFLLADMVAPGVIVKHNRNVGRLVRRDSLPMFEDGSKIDPKELVQVCVTGIESKLSVENFMR